MVEISIVIPAFNEEKRLTKTLESVYAFLTEYGKEFEVIVVDDGSKDDTIGVVKEFAKHHDAIKLLTYSSNQGKGFAVRKGVEKALGERIIFNDADGSSPIEELIKLESSLQNGFDVAIGSRAKPDETRRVDALAYRKFMGNFFNFIVQTLLLPGIQDTQCGFKMFTKKAAKEIFKVCNENGFAFDVEVLHIAKVRGLKVDEVPINWTNVDGSKVNLVLDSSKMFLDVVKISLRSLFGYYSKNVQSPAAREVPGILAAGPAKKN
jgi:dolichyl-phosphate beta-glucosyltransferase